MSTFKVVMSCQVIKKKLVMEIKKDMDLLIGQLFGW